MVYGNYPFAWAHEMDERYRILMAAEFEENPAKQ
jgi:hypothetical protein